MSKIIGIDLGTTNSVVAVMEGGEPVVITNPEGSRITPSVVGFTKSGERLVGQVAKRQAVTNPENTVFSIKRFMGRKYDEVNEEMKMVPYQVVRASNGDVRIKAGGKEYSPPEISAMILQKLKQAAEEYLGSSVSKAVITAPAYFNDAQRQATKDAGIDLGKDRMALQRLKEAAEKAKMELSTVMETDINLPFITADATGPKHMVKKLTRSKFEQLVEELLQKTVGPTKQALADAGLDPAKIDEVVLVGGSTRIPKVQSIVKELFGKDPHKGVNPDEVVAVGAAVQAGVLAGDVKDLLLLDVTFDIDANGIVNVQAKDLGTGKEQKITITASSGLGKDEVDRMMKEAESHAGEDKKRREEIEMRNRADQAVYGAERMVKDTGDRLGASEKQGIESAIEALKK